MTLLTIEIPNEGVWNAATCTKVFGLRYVVLENFRIHPFHEGVVRLRHHGLDANKVHVEEGMPGRIGDRDAAPASSPRGLPTSPSILDSTVTVP